MWRVKVFILCTCCGLFIGCKPSLEQEFILEISPAEITRKLAIAKPDSVFLDALQKAEKKIIEQEAKRFGFLFQKEYEKNNPSKKLVTYFPQFVKQRILSLNSTNIDVVLLLEKEFAELVDRTIEILKRRLERFGLREYEVELIEATYQISVLIPQTKQRARVKQLLLSRGKLEFWETISFQDYLKGWNVLRNQVELLPESDFEVLAVNKKDTIKVNNLLDSVKLFLPKHTSFLWSRKPTKKQVMYLYLIKNNQNNSAPVTGEGVVEARQELSQRGKPEVSLRPNARGTSIWKKFTRANLQKRIAVLVDGKVYAAPVVREVIPSGNCIIGDDFSDINEAKDLANILKSGSLPITFRLVSDGN